MSFAIPHRIQLSRRPGWRMPPDTVNVARPGRWGNPFPVDKPGPQGIVAPTRDGAVNLFRQMLGHPEMRTAARYPDDLSALRGKNLACWCPLGESCHADVLIERANAPTV